MRLVYNIYIVVEEVTHFDWERTRIIGASYDLDVCERMIEKAESEFKSFDGERVEYRIEETGVYK